jgi:hypothetical protein
MTTPTAPRPSIDQEAIRDHFHAALRTRTLSAFWTAIVDIPVLLAEISRLAVLLTWTRLQFANLLAAGHATIAAEHDGEDDPLSYLRDELDTHDSINDGDRR